MALDVTRPDARATIGWDGRSLREMLEESERLFAETGRYWGIEELELQTSDPIGYEKLFSQVRGSLVTSRETALNISSSPIVREIGELCFALYTPEGDSTALSTGIMAHVHTMSDAIKHMVRCDYDLNPGVRDGDVFANNNPAIGDIHTADVQTFVPIFWEGELIAWAGGVTHVEDIGALTPGGAASGPTTRFDDGMDLPCMKIGEQDQISRWHWERIKRRVRMVDSYILDERSRLAGCHMIREAVVRIVSEVGADRFKRFSREVIEEGRRTFKARIRQMTVPGRYRSPAFCDVSNAEQVQLPKNAQRDFIMHTPFDIRIAVDGTYELDFEGSSSWGYHSFNSTPSAMPAALWVQFTQTLICNDKVNDGAHFGVRVNTPPGTIANVGENEGSTSLAWGMLEPNFHAFPRSISRALQARGFIEEVAAGYGSIGNIFQGGGHNLDGSLDAHMNFEIACQGFGAKYTLDGLDYAAAMFNPEGDMGDVEVWEKSGPNMYLGRRIKANTAGLGRQRGGAGFESLFMIWNRRDYEVQNIGTSKMFTAIGLFGGYPGPTTHTHNLRGTDFLARAQAGETYAVGDGSYDDPQLFAYSGEREHRQSSYTLVQPVEVGDLYLSIVKGGGGLGDPLDRPVEQVKADVDEGYTLPKYAESVYGISDRDAVRRARLERGVPTRVWWEQARTRVLGQDFIEPVCRMYAESMRLSPRWAAEFRGFWDLPEDFDFDVVTPEVEVRHAAPGKVTPDAAADAYLELERELRQSGRGIEPPPATGSPFPTRATLEAMLDGTLPRAAVKDIQSGHKDPDRFDKWVAVLQDRVPYADPIVMPVGEALNVVRRADGALMIRCDCGHELCEHHRNWKMDALVHIRDTNESLRKVYALMSHCEPDWMELREYYCPSCARQLEVEGLPPGYPVAHEFLPDIEGFYAAWLERDLPT
jgi:N-methylhydantoinase B/oxoprolinase/acetone carboxylase alpha subunit/acetone carboxylase gamma subunit